MLHADADNKNSIGSKGVISYKPTKDDSHNPGFHYYGEDLDISDMGYLQKNDWVSFGGRSSFDRYFANDSKLKNIEYSIRYGHQGDTKSNTIENFINPKIEIELKDTNKFNFWTAFKSSGKNTTITRKNILSPFVKRPARYNLGGSYDSKNFSNFAIGAKLNFERGNKNNSWESKGYKKTWAEAAYYFFQKDVLTMRLGFNYRNQKE